MKKMYFWMDGEGEYNRIMGRGLPKGTPLYQDSYQAWVDMTNFGDNFPRRTPRMVIVRVDPSWVEFKEDSYYTNRNIPPRYIIEASWEEAQGL